MDALAASLPNRGALSVRSPCMAIAADGWAGEWQEPNRLHVAGAAHIVSPDHSGATAPLALAAHAYRTYGAEGVAKIQGQFCLVFCDVQAQEIVLAPDPFATRSIYYTECDGHLVFSSRLSALPSRCRNAIDSQAILEYLLYSAIPAPRTPFAGVHKIPAGHLLTCDRRGVRVSRYWDMIYAESRNGNAGSWAGQLRIEIEAAVRRYARAEQSLDRVGAFLSGGTDSSTVAGMLGTTTGTPTKTFSIGYHEEGYDELFYARAASRWFGTVQHEWKLSPGEALDALPAIAAYYEEPFGNASALPTYRCAQLAREHGIGVLFAGDGGDELFAGNERYGLNKVFALYHRLPRVLRATLLDPVLSSLPDGLPALRQVRRYVRRANIPNPRRMLSYNPMLSEPLSDLVSSEFLAAVWPDAMLAAAEAHYDHPAVGTSELNRLMYLDLQLAIADNDVRKVSGMAELAGIEVRYPLLDTRLAEFSGRIPSALKLRGFQKRYIFKRALADFLPPEVLKKRKHGFGAPVAVWMRNNAGWRDFVGDLLHDARARQRGYIKPIILDRFWKQLESDGASFYGDAVWPWLMLELWHRQHRTGDVAQRRSTTSRVEATTVA